MNKFKAIFKHLFAQDKFGTVPFRRKRAAELDGLAIRYVTKRIDDVDNVVGRGGSLSVDGKEFLVFTSGKVRFRAKIDKLDASFLLSGDGVVLTAPNLELGGETETLTAYFVYYRK